MKKVVKSAKKNSSKQAQKIVAEYGKLLSTVCPPPWFHYIGEAELVIHTTIKNFVLMRSEPFKLLADYITKRFADLWCRVVKHEAQKLNQVVHNCLWYQKIEMQVADSLGQCIKFYTDIMASYFIVRFHTLKSDCD